MKALNKLTTSLVSLTLSLTAVHATTVSFSEAEGYVDGSLSSQHPSSGYTWSYNGTASGLTVDKDNGGSVTIAGGFSGSPAIYSAPFNISVGTVFSVSMDFQFIGIDTTSTSGLNAFSLNLGTGATYNSEIKLTVSKPSWGTAGKYQAQQYTGTGTPATSVDPAALGLTTTGGTESNHLRLTLSGTVGANANGTTPYTAVLTNLDTSSTVFTINGYRDLSAFTTLYLNFSGGSAGSSVTITQLDYSVVPEPATWAMIVGGMGMLVLNRRVRRSLPV